MTKSTGNVKLPTGMKTSLAIPAGVQIAWIRDIWVKSIPLMHNKISLRRMLRFLDKRRWDLDGILSEILKLGLPELISTRMTLKLANQAICTPAGIARDVFIPVGNLTFPADFVIVDYQSDPKVPLILERPFLWTARTLIDVLREEMIIHDGDERLTLKMRHDTSSYSNQPQKESINLINVFN
nr:reverse transcriptase domain-containing protein [Tanacetum cinerariifolium]